MRQLKIFSLVERLEDAEALDPLVKTVRSAVLAVAKPRALRDLLHGVPFGHPIHPIEVMVPVGGWTAAAVLDLMPGQQRAARAMVGLGILGALPAVASGYMDWSQSEKQAQRVGIVHSASNAAALALYTLSWLQRRRGGSGKLLAFLGYTIVGVSGYLGGHLAYRQAVGASHVDDVVHLAPQGWQELCPLESLPEGRLSRQEVAGIPVLALRQGQEVRVLANTCSHMGAPLDEGEIVVDKGETCVQCPWHSSVFEMTTGQVVHGPATSPQPRFLARVEAGVVSVMLPDAGLAA